MGVLGKEPSWGFSSWPLDPCLARMSGRTGDLHSILNPKLHLADMGDLRECYKDFWWAGLWEQQLGWQCIEWVPEGRPRWRNRRRRLRSPGMGDRMPSGEMGEWDTANEQRPVGRRASSYGALLSE